MEVCYKNKQVGFLLDFLVKKDILTPLNKQPDSRVNGHQALTGLPSAITISIE